MRVRFAHSLAPAAAAVSVAAVLGACGGGASGVTPTDNTVKFGYWSAGTGYYAMIPKVLEEHPELASASGITIKAVPFANLQDLYAATTQGRVDIEIGGPGPAGSQAQQGAPVSVIGTEAVANIGLVGKTPTTCAGLKGKRIAQGAGESAAILGIEINQVCGLKPKTDYGVVPASTPADAVAQVVAGTADFALTWEPHTSRGVNKYGLKRSMKPADLKVDGHDLWQFVIIANDRLPNERIKPVMEAVKSAATWMETHPEESDKMAVGFGQEPGTVKTVIAEKAAPFDIHVVDDTDKKNVVWELQQVKDLGAIDGFPANGPFRK
ncbi:hypothetical protein GCM10009868_08000 [Terrabacter aerolatus]|uniref:SsuA/THI5-like domain-containing protein n=1 Tax=Terrabacter aerolatus TaxID=422442 RepID=A0A512D4Y0_9MICO|nr:PhnD/SsuA/transferrin family substrate-binding protein [Terrabacter aerolatus]GEO31535.1 hypothetical protein TAE01_33450 [Terrabacter aerolatus]